PAFGGAGGGTSQVSLRQCDLRRTLLINDHTHRYLVTPLDGGEAGESTAPPAPAPATSAPARRGGTVVYTTNITDTGERRQMFGLTARHLKTKLTIEPAPDACAQDRFRQETDGWYTDFEYGLSCAAAAASAHVGRAQPSGCQDR